jgi:hypothetical protein
MVIKQHIDNRRRVRRKGGGERRRHARGLQDAERRGGPERRRFGQRRGPSGGHVVTLQRTTRAGWTDAGCSCGASLTSHDRLDLTTAFIGWHETEIQRRAMIVDCR